ncbi:CDP-glucose 4,6-dehydratase [Paenibacillus sp. P96]|uniref:CDP-glucose 4,6-dehydratase n=1 Tax=Paenibacillus zeirhizosphaerae TaxID=2987519 RepID=A0ABT9FXA7_9BACL|nr:CDP-glucose 4,6-dehydratase [Paenibacillus sp. P96]MDP4099364.1 CDP-glucose 4,6-dehydratase [Paenibacillus sp. P96]
MAVSSSFWNGKKVLITGHTGFKGSWLTLWLHHMGAEVTGYALEPKGEPNLFTEAGVGDICLSVTGDVRNRGHLLETMLTAEPDIVIHMAAQPLVQYSYEYPVETFEVNVMGTVNVLEAVRQASELNGKLRAVLNVTTDKCYENQEWVWGYREHDRLGGYDPYSNSKACSEMVTAAYRSSYFNPDTYPAPLPVVATARAGNVIGGGDWSDNRIVPDCVRALTGDDPLMLRNPAAIRPWQHVLEPLSGYLQLVQSMVTHGNTYGGAWNFGPNEDNERNVEWLVREMGRLWGKDNFYQVDTEAAPHEALNLKLDSAKAKRHLGWSPRWDTLTGLKYTVEWYQAYQRHENMRQACVDQIEAYMAAI